MDEGVTDVPEGDGIGRAGEEVHALPLGPRCPARGAVGEGRTTLWEFSPNEGKGGKLTHTLTYQHSYSPKSTQHPPSILKVGLSLSVDARMHRGAKSGGHAAQPGGRGRGDEPRNNRQGTGGIFPDRGTEKEEPVGCVGFGD